MGSVAPSLPLSPGCSLWHFVSTPPLAELLPVDGPPPCSVCVAAATCEWPPPLIPRKAGRPVATHAHPRRAAACLRNGVRPPPPLPPRRQTGGGGGHAHRGVMADSKRTWAVGPDNREFRWVFSQHMELCHIGSALEMC